jgi:putative ABC transport system permease protein
MVVLAVTRLNRITRPTPEEYPMFFITYLRRELRRRMRQAVFITLGLALGVGLVVTVAAASAGVKKTESGVLSALYGVGTDVTVTGPPVMTGRFGQVKLGGQGGVMILPNGKTAVCENGKCKVEALPVTLRGVAPSYTAFAPADVAAVARLRDVSAAAGGLLLTEGAETVPRNGSPSVAFLSVDGVDTGHLALGPLSAGTITSGHTLTAADAGVDVAVVDSGYAASNHLRVGSALAIGKNVRFTVIGIVRQPQTGGSPDEIYIPLARAQALQLGDGSLATGEVDMIYVTATSAASIPAVTREITSLLPHGTVTTQASLASEVTTSVSSAAKLAGDLGRWLAVLVLIAAFAVASLLTLAAVARRAAEFGTLKALGWRTRRIVAQVLGESLAMGVAGAAAGVGLGFAGAAIIAAVAPAVSATVPGSSGVVSHAAVAGAPTGELDPAAASHVLTIPLSPTITAGVIGLAVVLAMAGGLLAGAFGSWRIARLRPASALALVA